MKEHLKEMPNEQKPAEAVGLPEDLHGGVFLEVSETKSKQQFAIKLLMHFPLEVHGLEMTECD